MLKMALFLVGKVIFFFFFKDKRNTVFFLEREAASRLGLFMVTGLHQYESLGNPCFP